MGLEEMVMEKPILIIEDDPLQLEMLARLLQRKLEMGAWTARNGREGLDVLRRDEGQSIRLVIMDLNMPVMGGLEALKIMREQAPGLPVVMLTGSKDIDDAVQAMKLGATDFLTKPFESERMIVTVRNALRIGTLTREVNRLHSEKQGVLRFNNLIGSEGGLAEMVNIGRRAAVTDIPVLIMGETGVGKEVFARALHGESGRSGKPFVALNCGAIPAQLVESTLFGHEKGSFTGATQKTAGKFREAEGGTIFLDEVGELPLDAQVKLLRVLQQAEIEPVGAARPVSVNVRVISATNRDLQELVRQGLFREDLFFRLNVLTIRLPSLRERCGDIPALAQHFIERFCARDSRPLKIVEESAVRLLQQYNWPGNVRELENALHRAMVLSDRDVLRDEDFIAVLGKAEVNEGQVQVASNNSGALTLHDAQGLFKTMAEIEREAMQVALNAYAGNITQAAKALGIAKSTFYRKMEEETEV
ncbi:MAG: sigma-54 dependent transcriptional regulator [Alphaproteobacteria bacterium]|nr:sigma-54 dependent transcriptional regulator [Alphaproteobacteria bacterium]